MSRREEDMAGFRESLANPYFWAVRLLLQLAADDQPQNSDNSAAAKFKQAFMLAERSRSAKLREELSRRLAAEEQVTSEGLDVGLFARWQDLQRQMAELDARRCVMNSRGSRAFREESKEQQGARARLLQASEAVERKLFFLNQEVAGLISAELPDLDELCVDLAPDEGIVAYLLSEKKDSLIVFCLDAEGVRAATVADRPSLSSPLSTLETCIAACERDGYPAPGGGGEGADWQAALTALGEQLLAAPDSLGWLSSTKRRLTFVPSGTLFALPFAALGLPGEQYYRPLIAQVEVAVVPQAFTRLYQKGKGKDVHGAVAILNPDGSLASSDRQALLLAESIPGVEIYRGDTSEPHPPLTARTVPDLIAGRRLVHLTCHGRYEQAAPWQSKLILAGENGATQSQLTALQIYGRLRGNHELIFAASCESGKATVLAGDAFIGLHRALLFRSRQVIATLFQVRDDATADLERLFYRAYADGGDSVSSLASAQRAFLCAKPGGSQDEPFYGYLPVDHPYWWAGFVAMG